MSTLILPQEESSLADSGASLIPVIHLRDPAIKHVQEVNIFEFEDSISTSSSSAAPSTTTEEITEPNLPDLLALTTAPIQAEADSAYLISSPYLDPDHLLKISTLDTQSSLLARALTTLATATPLYATAPYHSSLNWPTVFSRLRDLSLAAKHNWTAQIFYVVEFRSKLKEQIDRPLLFDLDKYSHAEANISGGLLKYWYGSPDSQRRNLATCEFVPSCLVQLLW